MKTKRTQPLIRFKGFNEDWVEKKLGEIADIKGGGTPSTKNPNYWNGNIDWYSPVEIDKQIFVSSSQKQITEEGLINSSAKILPVGTVLFTSRAGIGKTAILGKPGSTNQGFQSIIPKKDQLDSYFIYSRTNELKRYAERVGAGSTFLEVSGKQMEKMKIKVPETFGEQIKISDIYKKLDKLISLQEQKIELIKQVKKGLLQKLFPKKGSKVPEIRFGGFEGDWDSIKLSEISRIRTGKLNANAMVENGKYDFYTSGVEKYKIDEYAFLGPAITIAGNGATVGYMHIADGRFNAYQRTYVLDNLKLDRIFLFNVINKKLPNKIFNEARMGSIPYIVKDMLDDLIIDYSEQAENKKIGYIITEFNRNINYNKSKLHQLQSMKQSLLQQMFI